MHENRFQTTDLKCSFAVYTDIVQTITLSLLSLFSLLVVAFAGYVAFTSPIRKDKLFCTVIIIISVISWSLYYRKMGPHFFSRVIITEDGISCVLMGKMLKTVSWTDIRAISKCRQIFSYTTWNVERRYLVISGHHLSDEEKKAIAFFAGGKNDIYVIPYKQQFLEHVLLLWIKHSWCN